MADRDTKAYLDLLHEDCVFVFHKSGNEFSKSEWAEMVTGMMANGCILKSDLKVHLNSNKVYVVDRPIPIPIRANMIPSKEELVLK